MASLLIYAIPEIIYAFVMKLRGKVKWREIAIRLGLTLGKGRYYLWALGFSLLAIVMSFGIVKLIPADVMNNENFANSRFAGQHLTAMNFLSALVYGLFETGLGEELFFRGLIAGWLERRTKFWVANGIQAAIFTLPHLLLLAIEPRLWPIAFAVPFISGLMIGWLRLKSGSILPGWLVHSLSNIFSAIAVMRI